MKTITISEAALETIKRLSVELTAEIHRLSALLERCRPFIEADVQMMADISRHAPLDAANQAIHDSTDYESERLLRDMTFEITGSRRLSG